MGTAATASAAGYNKELLACHTICNRLRHECICTTGPSGIGSVEEAIAILHKYGKQSKKKKKSEKDKKDKKRRKEKKEKSKKEKRKKKDVASNSSSDDS